VIKRKQHSCVFGVYLAFPGQEKHSCDIFTPKTHSCSFLIVLYSVVVATEPGTNVSIGCILTGGLQLNP
jgi:hypothetical protein